MFLETSSSDIISILEMFTRVQRHEGIVCFYRPRVSSLPFFRERHTVTKHDNDSFKRRSVTKTRTLSEPTYRGGGEEGGGGYVRYWPLIALLTIPVREYSR